MDQKSKSEDKIWSPRSRQSKCLKAGKEAFRTQGEGVDLTIFDYWRWAHSDLLDNAARGILAEYLVAQAVNYTNEPRHEWDSVDVLTESRIKVEVKSAAYAQSWKQCKPSAIIFDIAPRLRKWNAKTNEYETYDTPKRTADAYVFCLLGGPCDRDPDPMDLDKWVFYVLATKTLTQEYPCQKTIGLNPLKSLVRCSTGRYATPYAELAQVIETEGKRR